jgi:hypothetical protein
MRWKTKERKEEGTKERGDTNSQAVSQRCDQRKGPELLTQLMNGEGVVIDGLPMKRSTATALPCSRLEPHNKPHIHDFTSHARNGRGVILVS